MIKFFSLMLVSNIKMVSAKLMLCKIAYPILLVALLSCAESNTVLLDEVEDTIACPNNCRTNGSDTEICNHTSGECLLGCKDGFAGQNCTLQCTDIDRNCKLCSTDSYGRGLICNECNRNFYRDNGKCLECNYWCKRSVSSSLATCRESDGYCEHGCRTGRYGFKCESRCGSTCKDTCHRVTRTCLNGCKYTIYCGKTCELPCQDGCVSLQCNQSCSCEKGCNPNYWGEKCQNLCDINCNRPTGNIIGRICDTANGSCIYGCNNKFWGSDCTNRCSSNCRNGPCDQMSGICTEGCISNRTYAENCTLLCNANCLKGTCARDNGHCTLGCIPGWYGKMCDKQCSDNCLNDSCNQSDGICVYGCNVGWYGTNCTHQCSDRCLDKICFSDTGNCSHGCALGYTGLHCDKDLESQKMCFGCDDISSPQYCDSVTHCQVNEICFLESHLVAHGIIYHSGCLDEKKCHMVETTNTSTVCVECCSNNMCNNKGCGNTDFPSREHRGPMCFACQHTGNPKLCDTVTMCTRNQVCSIEKYQWGDSFHYKQGCVNQVCNTLSRPTRSVPLCHSCCHDDFCNVNCTSNTSNNGEIFVG